MALVNGFDHDRSRDRHSMTSDLDDEEEDYPREVSQFHSCCLLHPPLPLWPGLATSSPLLSLFTSFIEFSLSLSVSSSPLQRVLLDRSIGKLGLSIAGGADHISHVFGLGRPGIYISKVIITSECVLSIYGDVRLDLSQIPKS